jgi:hypothetical protein
VISALSGIDGRNPCGFLAALGTLRLLTDHLVGDEVRLAWREGEAGAINPALTLAGESDEDLVSLVLAAHAARNLDKELGWATDVMKLPCETVRSLLAPMLANPDDRRAAQTVGACVVDVPRRRRGRADSDRLVSYTPLRLIPRVGRARFAEAALKVSRSVSSPEQVRTALYGPWRYEKVNSLRWDPGAPPPLRAYSAEAPTNFGPLGVPGAIALATAALCYFPLSFTSSGRACPGFGFPRSRTMRWPLWRDPLDEDATRITLNLPGLYRDELDGALLARHGIFARVSARRTQLGSDGELLTWGEVDLVE